jgi:uroporphyrinogen decarboxylase
MSAMTGFCKDVKPDSEAFLANLRRQGTPSRVHYIELFLDGETKDAICERFDLAAGISRDDPYFMQKREIAIQRFLGYDYVFAGLEGVEFPVWRATVPDTAEHPRAGGRSFQDEHHGPIMSWEDFEKYPWPDPHKASDRTVAWYERNLPDDMCLLPTARGHFCEHLCWLMGYETLCYSLYEHRDLVTAISRKLLEIYRVVMARLLEYERVGVVWGSDDMGFKTATLISPADLREFVLPGHKALAEMARAAGRPYLLHSCGNLREIMPDLLDDVKIDGKHSFEDTIELITDAKGDYGDRCAVLGGIDVDFLCRADEQAVRKRVRETLDVCMPGGGFCLGSGNSVANYVPVDNYLAMMDEGRRYAG